jgi:hypothetical protein
LSIGSSRSGSWLGKISLCSASADPPKYRGHGGPEPLPASPLAALAHAARQNDRPRAASSAARSLNDRKTKAGPDRGVGYRRRTPCATGCRCIACSTRIVRALMPTRKSIASAKPTITSTDTTTRAAGATAQIAATSPRRHLQPLSFPATSARSIGSVSTRARQSGRFERCFGIGLRFGRRA